MSLPTILVIGYGSELRCDDAAGRQVVAEIDRRGVPDVECVSVPQLVPELAAAFVGRERVYFVDAAPPGEGVQIRPIEARSTTLTLTHFGAPEWLLRLAAELYHVAPRAWLVSIPGHDFGVGMGLTAATECHVDQAVEALLEMLR